MLKKIGIKNFKSFKEMTIIELDRLNLFSGMNSSGKSTIYQILLLMETSKESYITYENRRIPKLKLNSSLLKLGECSEILNNKQDKIIELYFEWDDGRKVTLKYQLVKVKESEKLEEFLLKELINEKDEYYCKVTTNLKNFKSNLISRNCMFIDSQEIRVLMDEMLGKKDQKDFFNFYKEEIVLENVELSYILPLQFSVVLTSGIMENLITDDKKINFSKEKVEEFLENDQDPYNLISSSIMRPTNNSNNFFSLNFIKPFRNNPERLYMENNNPFESLVISKERKIAYEIDEDGKFLYKSLEEGLNYWISKKFNLADKIIVETAFSGLATSISFQKDGNSHYINNVGFGMSQIIPVLLQTLLSKNKIIIVDEPEIHLHPGLQSKLAEFFLVMSKLDKQIIIETHSEYLIEKLIYLKIKNKDENIKLSWVNKKDSISEVIEIKNDQYGFILNPPEGFLSEKNDLVDKLMDLRMSLT